MENEKKVFEKEEFKNDCPQKNGCDLCGHKSECKYAEIRAKMGKFHEVLDRFLESVGRKREDAIIGGSLGLFVQGFPITDVFHDIDIEMTYTPELEKALTLLQTSNPTQDKGMYPDRSETVVRRRDFYFNGVKFNVWLVPNIEARPYMYMNYFKYGSVLSILKYKFSYAREKDWDYYLVLDGIFKSWLARK